MLPRHGPPQIQDRTEYLPYGFMGLFVHTGNLPVDHDVYVDVPIPGMAEIDYGNIIFPAYILDAADDIWDFTAGDHNVLVVFCRVHVPERGGNEAAHPPEVLRFGFVLGRTEPDQSKEPDELLYQFRLFFDQVPVPIHLYDEYRPAFGRKPEIETAVNALKG